METVVKAAADLVEALLAAALALPEAERQALAREMAKDRALALALAALPEAERAAVLRSHRRVARAAKAEPEA